MSTTAITTELVNVAGASEVALHGFDPLGRQALGREATRTG